MQFKIGVLPKASRLSHFIEFISRDVFPWLLRKRTVHHYGVNDNLLSLRGFAALSVLIFHGMLAFTVDGHQVEVFKINWTTPSHIINQVICILMNGGAAVTFFFVHSGFVLTLSLDQRFKSLANRLGIVTFAYYVRRLFRLYPVIIMSVLIGYVAYYYFYKPIEIEAASHWLKGFFSQNMTFREIILNMIPISNSLNQFTWSLLVEAQISLIMPILYLALKRNSTIMGVFLLMAACVFFNIGDKLFTLTLVEPGIWVVHKYIFTFVLCFMVGGLATTFLLPSSHPSFSYKHRIIVALAILIFVRPLLLSHEEFAIWFEMLASVIIIHTVYYHQDGWLQKLASHPISRFYGQVSYSLYMLSSVTIYMCAVIVINFVNADTILNNGLIFNIVVTALSFFVITIMAAVSFYLVENPTMKFGKNVSQVIEAKMRK